MKLRSLELLPAAALLLILPASAALLPTATLDPKALQGYNEYISRYEADSSRVFGKTGTLWIDNKPNWTQDFAGGKSYAETRAVVSLPSAQIHHLFGTIRLSGMTIAAATAVMQNYSRYPEFFRPDIVKGSSQELSDSKPNSRHFQVFLEMVQSTAWLDVAFESSYDTHYDQMDDRRAMVTSRSVYLREYRDAHHLDLGTFPEGADHGFLWRTYTSWHLRERAGGVDMELNSISLSRPVPFGFGWWANRTARVTSQKMIDHTADAIRKYAIGPPHSTQD